MNEIIDFKTTETHRNCSKEYYYSNQEVILAKAREKYHLRRQKEKEERELRAEAEEQNENVIIPMPKKEKKKISKPEKPVKTIWDAVAYTDGYYRRKTTAVKPCRPFDPIKDTASQIKHSELLWIIEGVTDCSFNYNPDIWTGDVWEQEDSSMCLCSQKVKHNFVIIHIPSDKKFIVGSECIKKVSPALHKAILSGKCKICSKPALDRRCTHGREGYCSKECMPSKMPFGKYKGIRLDAIPIDYMEFLIKKFTHSKLMEELKQMVHFLNNRK